MKKNHRRKILIALLLICIVGCAVGCNKKVVITTEEGYNLQQDDQPYFQSLKVIAKTEDGYYLWMQDGLTFFDKQANALAIVCNQLNCEHNTTNCNANFFDFDSNIYFYENSLYMIESNANGSERYISKISKDGTKRESLALLFRSNNSENGVSYSAILHRGYLYYTIHEYEMDKKQKAQLYRIALRKNASPEIVTEIEGYGGDFADIQGYGNRVFIHESVYQAKDGEGYENTLKYFDLLTKEVVQVSEEKYRQFVVDSNMVYYTVEDKIYKMDLVSKNTEVFCTLPKDMFVELSFDGTYFYLDNKPDIYMFEKNADEKRYIQIINKEGVLVDTLELDKHEECMFGDRDYLFVYPQIANNSSIVMYDKAQIGIKKKEWKKNIFYSATSQEKGD